MTLKVELKANQARWAGVDAVLAPGFENPPHSGKKAGILGIELRTADPTRFAREGRGALLRQPPSTTDMG
jgi:hypothetical protein